jgi:hypothetical protein
MAVFECLARLRQAIWRFVSYVILVGEMGERPLCVKSGHFALLGARKIVFLGLGKGIWVCRI